MQKACDITDKGFRRVLKFTKPGVKEYEIEAEYVHEFIRMGQKDLLTIRSLLQGKIISFCITSKTIWNARRVNLFC